MAKVRTLDTGLFSRRTRPLLGAFLIVSCVVAVAPIVWLVYNSFKFDRGITNPADLSSFTLQNYINLLGGSSSEFTRLIMNSLIVVAGTMALCLVIGSFAAYSLSKFRWPRWVTMTLLGGTLFIQMLPPIALVPSYYTILNQFYMYDSLLGLIAVNTVLQLPFALFLMKVYFDAIPDEMREAAVVDGASDFRVFWHIILPVTKPGIAAAAIFIAVLTWNEFLMALSLTSSPNAQTVTVGIAGFVQQYSIRYGDMAAAAGIATIPLILLAAFAHKHIVSGLTSGAIKG